MASSAAILWILITTQLKSRAQWVYSPRQASVHDRARLYARGCAAMAICMYVYAYVYIYTYSVRLDREHAAIAHASHDLAAGSNIAHASGRRAPPVMASGAARPSNGRPPSRPHSSRSRGLADCDRRSDNCGHFGTQTRRTTFVMLLSCDSDSCQRIPE